MLQPNTAIICRDKVELDITLQMLEKENLCWCGGTKATGADWLYNKDCELLIYVSQPEVYLPRMHLEWDHMNVIERGYRSGWTYVESSNIFRNQIISERRKQNAT